MSKRFFLCQILIFVIANPISALAKNDSREIRKYYVDFVNKTYPEMTAIGKLYLQAEKSPLILQTNNEDAFALTSASIYILGINTYVEYAQDIILASAAEADIAVSTNGPVQVFSGPLNKFPKSITSMSTEMTKCIDAIKDSELKSICKEVLVHAENLEAAFGDWPGTALRQHLGKKTEDDSKIPDSIVKLGDMVKSITQTVNDHFRVIVDSEKQGGKYGLDYVNLLMQSNRSIMALTILVPDIFCLNFEKFRLHSLSTKDENIDADMKMVENVLDGRLKKYQELLAFLESQCAVLHEEDAKPCKVLVIMYHDFLSNIHGS